MLYVNYSSIKLEKINGVDLNYQHRICHMRKGSYKNVLPLMAEGNISPLHLASISSNKLKHQIRRMERMLSVGNLKWRRYQCSLADIQRTKSLRSYSIIKKNQQYKVINLTYHVNGSMFTGNLVSYSEVDMGQPELKIVMVGILSSKSNKREKATIKRVYTMFIIKTCGASWYERK